MLFVSLGCLAQKNLTGYWQGELTVGGGLKLVFHFFHDSTGKLSATMDSPDQGAFDIKTDEVMTWDDSIKVTVKSLNASYSGKIISDSSMDGIFRQGVKVPLKLRKLSKPFSRLKPQTPVPPFPYHAEEVNFPGPDTSIVFAGTLTHPFSSDKNKKASVKYPAILLITGSGAQNRDEEIMGHKPFMVLADHLTKAGFAVLRVDDRGTAKSTGTYTGATTADFVKDAASALEFLKKQNMIDPKKIGLLGHSEGGLIATMLAAEKKELAFIILMAAPGVPSLDLMVEQNIALLKANGMSDSASQAYGALYRAIAPAILSSLDTAEANRKGRTVFDSWFALQTDAVIKTLGLRESFKQNIYLKKFTQELFTPWFKYFMQADPGPYLQKLNCKVLALNGEKDIQVVATPNLEGIRKSLKKSKSRQYDIVFLPGLNHLLQTCQRCTPQEYGKLDETISPAALELISSWLSKNILLKK
jgi:pimeloyl-ACP methyl ester carboxylesterase